VDSAKLLEAFSAIRALSARIHITSDTGVISRLKSLHFCAHTTDTPHNFMARDYWVFGFAPFVPYLVDVRVANSAVKNIDEYIMRPNLSAFKAERFERAFGVFCGVTTSRVHLSIIEEVSPLAHQNKYA